MALLFTFIVIFFLSVKCCASIEYSSLFFPFQTRCLHNFSPQNATGLLRPASCSTTWSSTKGCTVKLNAVTIRNGIAPATAQQTRQWIARTFKKIGVHIFFQFSFQCCNNIFKYSCFPCLDRLTFTRLNTAWSSVFVLFSKNH